MKKNHILLCIMFASLSASAQSVFINEIHYDNVGGDVGEFVEVAGPSGTDLTNWSIVLYNGADGTSYNNLDISVFGTFPDEGAGTGTLAFHLPSGGMQNGSPDGIALVDNNANVIQFLSYEGSFMAFGGPAVGITSTDIGVSETGTTAIGVSLQLNGTGYVYNDFTWSGPSAASPGSLNSSQLLTLSIAETEDIPFLVFPNPVTNGSVTIVANNKQAIQVSVFNVLGKQVIEQNVKNKNLNVSSLNPGIYILKIAQNGNSTTKKLVIK